MSCSKQIMSEVYKDARSGKVDLGDHNGFIAEVKRRLAAAELGEADMPELARREADSGIQGAHADHAEHE